MMICYNREMRSINIRAELRDCPYYCQALSFNYGIISFAFREGTTCIRDDTIYSMDSVGQNCADTVPAGVSADFSVSPLNEVTEDRHRCQSLLE